MITVVLVLLACSILGDFLSLIPGVEPMADSALDAIPFRPSWWVTRDELRHEGDAEWYRDRAEQAIDDFGRGSSRWVREDGETYVLPVHMYRALSAHEALQIAARHDFEPSGPGAIVPARRILLRVSPSALATALAAVRQYVNDQHKPGDRLPPAREIADVLGLQHLHILKALRHLDAKQVTALTITGARVLKKKKEDK
ncbi:hypothetical protein [Streptomyces sp. x-80]|uniref:hypothetical protein n=1 Tax=Streptomyces sp. x-80 TaxID=2789282 RepID=UPI003980BE07